MEDTRIETPNVIYSSYTDAQKRATKKYREANREKVNEQRKKYYERRKEKDPNFLQYKRDKAKEYYIRKKESKDIELDEPVDELVVIDEPEPELAWSKPNLKIEDLQDVLINLEVLEVPEVPEVPPTPKPKTTRKPRTKKEIKDLIESV